MSAPRKPKAPKPRPRRKCQICGSVFDQKSVRHIRCARCGAYFTDPMPVEVAR